MFNSDIDLIWVHCQFPVNLNIARFLSNMMQTLNFKIVLKM